MSYNSNNIFAKILRGEIPCDSVYENDYALAFRDINPQAPTHVLVIPKGPYVSMDDFSKDAPDDLVVGFFRAVGHVARLVEAVEKGYRIMANCGADARQDVEHFHVHIVAGRDLGGLLKKL